MFWLRNKKIIFLVVVRTLNWRPGNISDKIAIIFLPLNLRFLWVPKRIVSLLRRFFWVPTAYVFVEKQQNYFLFVHFNLEAWQCDGTILEIFPFR